MKTLFLDANIFFAATSSTTGGSRKLFELSKMGDIKLVSNLYAIKEAKNSIKRKLGEDKLLDLMHLLTHLSSVDKNEKFDIDLTSAYSDLIVAKDLPILLGALNTRPDLLITLDRKDFNTKKLQEAKLPFLIQTPSEFIQNY